jgi:two-component system response regulator AgrA
MVMKIVTTNYPIIVCDDDPDLANQLATNINSAIQDLAGDNSSYSELKERVTFVANDFAQVVGYIVANDIKNGIYFLDIELSQQSEAKNGVDLAEFIKKQDENAQIIFVTAYDKYAPLTYRRRIGAIDYISKNLSSDEIIQRLEETLRGAISNLTNMVKYGNRNFKYKIGRNVFKVSENEVFYIENSTMQHKVHMVTEHGDVEFKGNVSQVAKNADFLTKVSQSALVNPNNVKAIDTHNKLIIFDKDNIISYSRAYKKNIKQLMAEFETIDVI